MHSEAGRKLNELRLLLCVILFKQSERYWDSATHGDEPWYLCPQPPVHAVSIDICLLLHVSVYQTWFITQVFF